MHMQKVYQVLQYLLTTNSIDIITEDLNYDLLKVWQNKFLDIFTDHLQIVNKPRHVSGSLVDHVSIIKAFMEGFFINVTVENIYFSGYDAARIVTETFYLFLYLSIKVALIRYERIIHFFF